LSSIYSYYSRQLQKKSEGGEGKKDLPVYDAALLLPWARLVFCRSLVAKFNCAKPLPAPLRESRSHHVTATLPVRMRSRLCTALSPMQRGFLSRLISRAVRGAHIPANERLSVVLTHLRHSNNLLHTMSYSIIERGQPNTLEYRIFYSKFLINFWLETMRFAIIDLSEAT